MLNSYDASWKPPICTVTHSLALRAKLGRDHTAAHNVSCCTHLPQSTLLSTQNAKYCCHSPLLYSCDVSLTWHYATLHGIGVTVAASGSILMQRLINGWPNVLCQKDLASLATAARKAPHVGKTAKIWGANVLCGLNVKGKQGRWRDNK